MVGAWSELTKPFSNLALTVAPSDSPQSAQDLSPRTADLAQCVKSPLVFLRELLSIPYFAAPFSQDLLVKVKIDSSSCGVKPLSPRIAMIRMKVVRKRCIPALLLLASCWLAISGIAQTAPPAAENGRKIMRRVDPVYPEMAKRMNLSGTVKVFAVVGPDGAVKAVEPVGGSPLLVSASEDAVKKWKFVPAAQESRELVEFRFHPE
jgi:TonB family protein